MTTASNSIVFDKFGKRVHRTGGILEDGDRVQVPVSLMDYNRGPFVSLLDAEPDAPPTDEQLADLRDARDARIRDAWKTPSSDTEIKPHSETTKSTEQLLDERDRRVSDMWKQ